MPPSEIEHRDREAAVDVRCLRQIGDIANVEAATRDRARERLEDAGNAAQQGRFAGAVRTDHSKQRAGSYLARKMMHCRMAVIAERDVLECELRRHAYLIESQTTAHSAAETVTAAARREATGMRKIDHDAACAGCGEAGPWLCAWAWSCPSLWELGETIAQMLYYNIGGVHLTLFFRK